MSDRAHSFFLQAMNLLEEAGVPWLVGGAFALRAYTGIERDTKDFDILLKQEDLDAALDAIGAAGYTTEKTHPHWLAKTQHDGMAIDLIYNSGNGLCPIDDSWFSHAVPTELWGRKAMACPAEELIWQKCYIMERERFDGADVMHLIHTTALQLDWNRLLQRFGPDWPVLFSHLVLFEYIYPGEKNLIPPEVRRKLLQQFQSQASDLPQDTKVCRGTLLSRASYLFDLEKWGYTDAREERRCAMSAEDIRHWTDAIAQPDTPRP